VTSLPPTITAVVFDLGGVLTGPPFGGIAEYEESVGLPAGSITQYFRDDPVYHSLERGEISARDFWKSVGTRVQDAHGVRIDLRTLAATTEEASHLRPDAVGLVRSLHGRFALGLLTNNVAEAGIWREQLPHELFDTIVDSSAVGFRKPDPRIYELVIEQLGRDAAEIVFIDDFEENLPPAEALGIRTILFVSVDQCRAELAALGVSS
jgi:epoxide hydrolase-like predicted phosphatase